MHCISLCSNELLDPNNYNYYSLAPSQGQKGKKSDFNKKHYNVISDLLFFSY